MGAEKEIPGIFAFLGNFAVFQEEHPVGGGPGEGHFVGDDQHGAAAAGQIQDHLQHLVDHLRVQSGGDFVQQQNFRVHNQRPDDGDSLLLSAGQLPGVVVAAVCQPHPLQQGHGLLLRLGPLPLLHLHGGQQKVFQHRHVGKQVVALEHHADFLPQGKAVPVVFSQGDAIQEDLPGLNALQAVQAAKQGALAAAGRADDDGRLPLPHLQIQVPEDDAASKFLAQVPHLQQGLLHYDHFLSR